MPGIDIFDFSLSFSCGRISSKSNT
jgi:hypothetical protein